MDDVCGDKLVSPQCDGDASFCEHTQQGLVLAKACMTMISPIEGSLSVSPSPVSFCCFACYRLNGLSDRRGRKYFDGMLKVAWLLDHRCVRLTEAITPTWTVKQSIRQRTIIRMRQPFLG